MCVYKSTYNYTIKLDNCATHTINYHHKVGRTTIKLLPPGQIVVYDQLCMLDKQHAMLATPYLL